MAKFRGIWDGSHVAIARTQRHDVCTTATPCFSFLSLGGCFLLCFLLCFDFCFGLFFSFLFVFFFKNIFFLLLQIQIIHIHFAHGTYPIDLQPRIHAFRVKTMPTRQQPQLFVVFVIAQTYGAGFTLPNVFHHPQMSGRVIKFGEFLDVGQRGTSIGRLKVHAHVVGNGTALFEFFGFAPHPAAKATDHHQHAQRTDGDDNVHVPKTFWVRVVSGQKASALTVGITGEFHHKHACRGVQLPGQPLLRSFPREQFRDQFIRPVKHLNGVPPPQIKPVKRQ